MVVAAIKEGVGTAPMGARVVLDMLLLPETFMQVQNTVLKRIFMMFLRRVILIGYMGGDTVT
jgi:hypothetical protein